MNTNQHYTRLADVLAIINQKSITSLDTLQEIHNETLYAELWLAIQNFINYYALRSKSHLNAKGERIEGNAEKIRTLLSRGAELEDIRENILAHVLCKLNHILIQPMEKQINYTYRMINNCVYDEFRKQPPANVIMLSLHDPVQGHEGDSELQDFIADYNTPENQIIAMETIHEIYLSRRTEVLNEISRLADKPAEGLVRLCCVHLGMKPAAMAKLLVNEGLSIGYRQVLQAASSRLDVSMDELRSLLSKHAITEKSFKLDTRDPMKVSAQISRLAYRADKRLCG